MTIYLSLLVAIISILMFALCTSEPLKKIGFAAYCCGLLAFLLCFCEGGKMIGVLPR